MSKKSANPYISDFQVHEDGSVEPRRPVQIGGVGMTSGVRLFSGAVVEGVDFAKGFKKILETFEREFAIANTHLRISQQLISVVKKEHKEINQYWEYFFFSFIAHTQIAIVALAKFFDDLPYNSHSFSTLISAMADPNTQKRFQTRLAYLRKKFETYEAYRNKVLAHFDVEVTLNSTVVPSLNFLDDEHLGGLLKEIKKFMAELRTALGDTDVWHDEYTGVKDRHQYILNALKERDTMVKEQRFK